LYWQRTGKDGHERIHLSTKQLTAIEGRDGALTVTTRKLKKNVIAAPFGGRSRHKREEAEFHLNKLEQLPRLV
jgi:hypothetical protein